VVDVASFGCGSVCGSGSHVSARDTDTDGGSLRCLPLLGHSVGSSMMT